MLIKFHKYFEKSFKKLSPHVKKKTLLAIDKFSKNPHDKSLHNHQLKGKLAEKCAFSVTNDIRIIFQEYNNYTFIIMLDIGTHNQVY